MKLFSYPVSYLGMWQAVSVLLFLVVSGFICTRSLQREQGKWISSNMAHVLIEKDPIGSGKELLFSGGREGKAFFMKEASGFW